MTDQLLRSTQFVNLKVQNLQSNTEKLAYTDQPSKLWLCIVENSKPSLHNIGHKLSVNSFWCIPKEAFIVCRIVKKGSVTEGEDVEKFNFSTKK